jgi:translation initiation factor IF-2
VLDTPGQIEVFTWSASGSIITESLAAVLPTCVVYVVDTPRAQSPATFVANMMYACSILYKTRLPLVLAFNKTDVVSHEFAREWMTDFEAFQTAARDASDAEDGTYMSSLTQSMGLVLEEFYRTLECVGVSAATGAGLTISLPPSSALAPHSRPTTARNAASARGRSVATRDQEAAG